MATAILTETLQAVRNGLTAVQGDIEMFTTRLHALAMGIQALLPADSKACPVFAPSPVGASSATIDDGDRYRLRRAVDAARVLADLVDDMACMLSDSAGNDVADILEKLGAPEVSHG